MTSYFCVVFLLSAGMATAVALSDLDRVLKAFIQVLNEEEAVTGCASRSHKIYYTLGNRTEIFRYRACFNHVTHLMCYDSRERLPRMCPQSFRGEDCIEIEWRIHNATKLLEICDYFGLPCQKPITGMGRTDSQGQCNSYEPQHQVTPGPQPQPEHGEHPHPGLHPSIHLQPELHQHLNICQEVNTAKEMEQLQDCFCVSQHRTKVCEGDKCHELVTADNTREFNDCFCVIQGKRRMCRGRKCPDLITTENTAMYDDCFCVFNGRRKLCHGNSCHELVTAQLMGNPNDCLCVIQGRQKSCYGGTCQRN